MANDLWSIRDEWRRNDGGTDVGPARSARHRRTCSLREYAQQIGIDPAFTIHDRADLHDLMHPARHELGFSKTETRFPTKATCLAIYSRAVNAELPLDEVLRGSFPWCAEWEHQLRELFSAYVEAKPTQNVPDYDDLLLLLGPNRQRSGACCGHGRAVRPWCWSMNTRTPNRLQSSILLGVET